MIVTTGYIDYVVSPEGHTERIHQVRVHPGPALAAQLDEALRDGPITVSDTFFRDLTAAVFPPPPPGHRSILDRLREMHGEEQPPAA